MATPEVALSILLRVKKSPTWWARLAYPEGKWWTEEEKEVLRDLKE